MPLPITSVDDESALLTVKFVILAHYVLGLAGWALIDTLSFYALQ